MGAARGRRDTLGRWAGSMWGPRAGCVAREPTTRFQCLQLGARRKALPRKLQKLNQDILYPCFLLLKMSHGTQLGKISE